VLLLGARLLPDAIHAAGRPLARMSASAQLAVANVRRNRIRTAATGLSLLVGTVLLALLTTGIHSARESIVAQIDRQRPFDLVVRMTDDSAISADLATAIGATEAVVTVAPVSAGTLDLRRPDGSTQPMTALGLDRRAVQAVAHAAVTLPDDGTVRANPEDVPGLPAGGSVTLAGPLGHLELTVVPDPDVVTGQIELTEEDLARLSDDLSTSQLRLRLAPGIGSEKVQQVTTDLLALDDHLDVSGGAQERAYYDQILDTLLSVVLALLAVAVVIAVVGIGNTAALSVIERRRESALLRAVGLTRGQTVGMICLEATLTATVAALLGLVVGVLLGWAAITTLGGSSTRIELSLHVPWAQLGVTLIGAAAAGTLAAILPAVASARRAPAVDLSGG
jgi:putative ABC transport system permease protein